MKVIVETSMRGYKAAIFQNQPVHDYFNNLQAVLRDVSPSGELEHLFPRPYADNGKITDASKVRWMTNHNGNPESLAKASDEIKISTAKKLHHISPRFFYLLI